MRVGREGRQLGRPWVSSLGLAMWSAMRSAVWSAMRSAVRSAVGVIPGIGSVVGSEVGRGCHPWDWQCGRRWAAVRLMVHAYSQRSQNC